MPAGITTGVRGASLELGGETVPRSLARIAPRDYTPLGKSRGGTPEGELSGNGQRRTPRCGGLRPCVFRRSISFCFRRNGNSEERQRGHHPSPDFLLPLRASGLRAPRCGGLKTRRSSQSERRRHVTEIGRSAGKGACGNESACFPFPASLRSAPSPRVASRGEGNVAIVVCSRLRMTGDRTARVKP
jgi:hypothetical protein